VDFGAIQLSPGEQLFAEDVASFLDEHLTDDDLALERGGGEGHSITLHRAMGERGWVMPHWEPEQGGAGLDPTRRHILATLLRRRGAPWASRSTTTQATQVLQRWASEELKQNVLPGVAAGQVCIALGYTEPDCGSDLAAAATRLTLDGDDWVVNGSKMFTTGAQHCQYCLLLGRSDPGAPKHRGLTVVLVPLDLPGVEIRPIHTLGGERTNVVFFSGVRVSARYQVGPRTEGWSVLASALDAEHGETPDDSGLQEINGELASMYVEALIRLARAALSWAGSTNGPNGRPLAEDSAVAVRLGQLVLDIETCRNTPGSMGKVLAADVLIRHAADFLELVGHAGLVPEGEPGAVQTGIFEWTHRYAQGTAIYGGTTEILRNVVATRVVGLPRPPGHHKARPSTRTAD
jgi:3-oxocholest-4-en-26-oyl-CoA dehydrogenase alpha subunit